MSPTFPTGIDEQQERKLSCIFTLSLKNHDQLPYLIRHRRKAAPRNPLLLRVLLLLVPKHPTLPSKADWEVNPERKPARRAFESSKLILDICISSI